MFAVKKLLRFFSVRSASPCVEWAPHALNPSWPCPQRFLLRPSIPGRALNASCCALNAFLAAPSTAIEFCGGGDRAGVENAERLVALDALAWNPRESDWRGTLPPLTASMALTIMAFSRCWPSSTLAVVGHGSGRIMVRIALHIVLFVFFHIFELTGRW